MYIEPPLAYVLLAFKIEDVPDILRVAVSVLTIFMTPPFPALATIS